MKTFFDIVMEFDFRKDVYSRIASEINEPLYKFTEKFPLLYKYRSLSGYAVDDVINGNVTASAVSMYNDMFDGAMHGYGTVEKRKNAAELEWKKVEKLYEGCNLTNNIIQKDYYVNLYKEHFKTEARLKFRQLDYLGTYGCCFSERKDSSLMWAHYADSSKGFCVEYDFNSWDKKCLQRYLLFPMAYSSKPVNISDWLDDDAHKSTKYPIEKAVLCAALNKSEVWSYEREWRLLYILPEISEQFQRLPIRTLTVPSAVYFGYHFLKNFFYYENRQIESCKNNIQNMLRLIEYIVQNNILVYVMTPAIGTYEQKALPIDVTQLKRFMLEHFEDEEPESMRYYYVVHDELMDILEEVMD